MDWSKFDENIQAMEDLKGELDTLDKEGGERLEVPVGDYEVTITKVEQKESKTGRPMVSIWLKIVNGKYKGQMIFYNQLIEKAFGIHLIKQFFMPFSLSKKIDFESYSQFAQEMERVESEVKNIEFALSYTTNDKGWSEYKVTQIFDF